MLYLIGVLFLFGIGVYTYLKYKKYSGIFFLLSTIFLGIWGVLYILIFGFIDNQILLLYVFRLMYVLSFLSLFSMLLYIYFFARIISIKTKQHLFLLFLFISIIFIFTPLVVKDLRFIEDKGYFFENYGVAYNIVLFLYIIFTPLLLIISYFRIKSLNYINKIRLQIIVGGFSIFIFSSLLFYMFLPYFGIYLFENAIILCLLPFIFSIIYATNVYSFSNIKFKLGKILIFSLSLFFTIFFINIIKRYFIEFPNIFLNFWNFSDFDSLETIYLLLGINIFLFLYYFGNKLILSNMNLSDFEKEINKSKKYIFNISNIEDLNIFLSNIFLKMFKIRYINVNIKNNNLEICKYFKKDISRDVFINDIVFIEENKYKFNLKKLKNELDNKIYLILPLFNNKRELIGTLDIGGKPFKDYFSLEEIKIFKGFSEFIVGHLKYIEVYSKISDLNINLDRKVDEKTIEYNQLLSKQTEFISMASHEIKSPIGSSIFQLDYILDEIKEGETSIKRVEKDLKTLNNTLIKVGDLTNKIFSVQKYDLNKIILYKQKINFAEYLKQILFLFKQVNKNIDITVDIDMNIGFLNIDKIQFTQVIDNLLNNALKFSNKLNPQIHFVLKNEGKKIILIIEDNGKGFQYSDNKIIFEKYNSGNSSSAGIGLGLYLCKRIVEMHKGYISAENSIKLGGAKFIIILSKNNNI